MCNQGANHPETRKLKLFWSHYQPHLAAFCEFMSIIWPVGSSARPFCLAKPVAGTLRLNKWGQSGPGKSYKTRVLGRLRSSLHITYASGSFDTNIGITYVQACHSERPKEVKNLVAKCNLLPQRRDSSSLRSSE
jgi:hypothetical protein